MAEGEGEHNNFSEIHAFLTSALERRWSGEEIDQSVKRLEFELRWNAGRFEDPLSALFTGRTFKLTNTAHEETVYVLYILRDIAKDEPDQEQLGEVDALSTFFDDELAKLREGGLITKLMERIPQLFESTQQLDDTDIVTYARIELELSCQILFFLFFRQDRGCHIHTFPLIETQQRILGVVSAQGHLDDGPYHARLWQENPHAFHIFSIMQCAFCALCLVDLGLIETKSADPEGVREAASAIRVREVNRVLTPGSPGAPEWRHGGFLRASMLMWAVVKVRLFEEVPSEYGGFMHEVDEAVRFTLEGDDMSALGLFTEVLRSELFRVSENCEVYTAIIKKLICEHVFSRGKLSMELQERAAYQGQLPGDRSIGIGQGGHPTLGISSAMPRLAYWQQQICLLREIYEILPEFERSASRPDEGADGVSAIIVKAARSCARDRQSYEDALYYSNSRNTRGNRSQLESNENIGEEDEVAFRAKAFQEALYTPLMALLSALVIDEGMANDVYQLVYEAGLVRSTETGIQRLYNFLREGTQSQQLQQSRRIGEVSLEFLAADIRLWSRVYRYRSPGDVQKLQVLLHFVCSRDVHPTLKAAIFELLTSYVASNRAMTAYMWSFVDKTQMLSTSEGGGEDGGLREQFRGTEATLQSYDATYNFLLFIHELLVDRGLPVAAPIDIVPYVRFAFEDVFSVLHLLSFSSSKDEWNLRLAALRVLEVASGASSSGVREYVASVILKGTGTFERLGEVLSARTAASSQGVLLAGMNPFPSAVEDCMLCVLSILQNVHGAEDALFQSKYQRTERSVQRLSSLLLVRQDFLVELALLILPPYSADVASQAISLLHALCGASPQLAQIIADHTRSKVVGVAEGIEERLLGSSTELQRRLLAFLLFQLQSKKSDLGHVLLGDLGGRTGAYTAILRLLNEGERAAEPQVLVLCLEILCELCRDERLSRYVVESLLESRFATRQLDTILPPQLKPHVQEEVVVERLRHRALVLSLATLVMHSAGGMMGKPIVEIVRKLFHPLYDSLAVRLLRTIAAREPQPIASLQLGLGSTSTPMVRVNGIGDLIDVRALQQNLAASNTPIERLRERMEAAAAWNDSVLRLDAASQLARSWASIVIVIITEFVHMLEEPLELLHAILHSVIAAIGDAHDGNRSGKENSSRVVTHLGEVVVQATAKLRSLKTEEESEDWKNRTSGSAGEGEKDSVELHDAKLLQLLVQATIMASRSQKLRADLCCGLFHYMRLIDGKATAGSVDTGLLLRLLRVVGDESVRFSPGSAVPSYIPCVALATAEQLMASFPFLLRSDFFGGDTEAFVGALIQRTEANTLSLGRTISIPDPPNLNALYLFEARMSFLGALARTPQGADYLLQRDILSSLATVTRSCLSPYSDLALSARNEMDDVLEALPIPSPNERHHSAYMAVVKVLTAFLVSLPGNNEVAKAIGGIISQNSGLFTAVLAKGGGGLSERDMEKLHATSSLFALLSEYLIKEKEHKLNLPSFSEMFASLVSSLAVRVFEDYELREKLRGSKSFAWRRILSIFNNSLHFILNVGLATDTEKVKVFKRDFSKSRSLDGQSNLSTLIYLIDRISLDVERASQRKGKENTEETRLLVQILEHTLYIFVDHLRFYMRETHWQEDGPLVEANSFDIATIPRLDSLKKQHEYFNVGFIESLVNILKKLLASM